MATILVIILRVNRPNFVHFRTVNAQKPSPKGEATAWSAYSWICAWNGWKLTKDDNVNHAIVAVHWRHSSAILVIVVGAAGADHVEGDVFSLFWWHSVQNPWYGGQRQHAALPRDIFASLVFDACREQILSFSA